MFKDGRWGRCRVSAGRGRYRRPAAPAPRGRPAHGGARPPPSGAAAPAARPAGPLSVLQESIAFTRYLYAVIAARPRFNLDVWADVEEEGIEDPQALPAPEVIAEEIAEKLAGAGYGEITTELAPLGSFYYAEDYHQQYLHKNPGGYCPVHATGVSCPIGLAAG